VTQLQLEAAPKAGGAQAGAAVATSGAARSPAIGRKLAARLVDARALAAIAPALADLADRALEPNPFLHPAFFLAVLDHVAEAEELVALVVGDETAPGGLVGFLPLRAAPLHRRLPLRVLRSFAHVYGFADTPLVDAAAVPDLVEAIGDRLASGGMRALHLTGLPVDGPLWPALTDGLSDRGIPWLEHHRTERALLVPKSDAATYLASALIKKRRKELARQRRRLAEQGALELRRLEPGGDVDRWTGDFLELEARGWKGRAGTAMVQAHPPFFTAMARAMHGIGRLEMLGFFLDDRPIAMKCNLLHRTSGDGPCARFAFKIAFDERFDAFSPGVLLELEQIAALHEPDERGGWMDSCASEEHFMINRLWTGRRHLASLLVAPPSTSGRITIAGARALARLRRRPASAEAPIAGESP